MASISFAHFASTGKLSSTKFVVETVRKLYPDSYYFLASDAIDDHSQLANQYNLDFHLFQNKLGYPIYPKGYNGVGVKEWLSRLKIGCDSANTSHIIMMEDDVLITKKITVKDDWEIAAHELNPNGLGNAIRKELMDLIEFYSGKKPKTFQYGAGGGSIFNVKTFLENYDKVSDFFLNHTDIIAENFYPQIGWIDCFMTVYYMLCGKDYTVNIHLTDTHHHNSEFNYDNFISTLPYHIEIINNYKKYYWNQ